MVCAGYGIVGVCRTESTASAAAREPAELTGSACSDLEHVLLFWLAALVAKGGVTERTVMAMVVEDDQARRREGSLPSFIAMEWREQDNASPAQYGAPCGIPECGHRRFRTGAEEAKRADTVKRYRTAARHRKRCSR